MFLNLQTELAFWVELSTRVTVVSALSTHIRQRHAQQIILAISRTQTLTPFRQQTTLTLSLFLNRVFWRFRAIIQAIGKQVSILQPVKIRTMIKFRMLLTPPFTTEMI